MPRSAPTPTSVPVTRNYDGFFKNKTTIGKEAFVGTNSSLVAPVKIGDRAYIESGSVITKDVPRTPWRSSAAHRTTAKEELRATARSRRGRRSRRREAAAGLRRLC
jgi:bifunctional UDP-N-acetylglucosamine pyrophosphorylase/glucosamine-1-phosphate N-acetyltransferase